MTEATAVFTPTDMPTLTYVERSTRDFEKDLREAFSIPKMIVSISGPSKSGKTVLVRKVVSADHLIHVYGASIRGPNDLWESVIAWMGGPVQRNEGSGSNLAVEIGVSGGGKVGIPLIAEGKADASRSASATKEKSTTLTFGLTSLDDIVREIGGSDYVVFVDDFHYIDKSVQLEIGKQIKAAAEKGVRVCTASVPHRSDDVVRSNSELRGRVTAVDMSYWTPDELRQIAHQGFRELNVDLAPSAVSALAAEAFGSPQLMQAISLNFCFELGIRETKPVHERVEIDPQKLRQIFDRTSVTTDYSTLLTALHAGPKQRGTERKQFDFVDSTRGDVYRCVLLAIKADPSSLSFRYDEMLKRTQEVCRGESPAGSSVSESLSQMAKLARTVQDAPVIEWDDDVLDIVEPYFLFFLRWSSLLDRLSRKA